MACGKCGNKNKTASKLTTNKRYSVMGNYKYLKPNQINKRLEVFKRMYCKDCSDRYECNFEMYNKCTKINKGDK